MRPIRKRLGLFVAMLLTMLPAMAQTFEFEGIYYNVLSGTSVEVTSSKGTAYSGDINVPETVTNNGVTYTVTSIGSAAFNLCSNVKSVALPKTIKSIGSLAFQSTGIASIVIPDAVTTINQGAFYNCSKLTDVQFGSGLTTLGYEAFSQTAITSAILPDALTVIGERAFRQARALKTVSLGNAVTSIGNSSFEQCDELTEINLPETLQKIGNLSFSSCGKLTSIFIPDNVTSLGTNVFSSCQALTEVKLSSQITSIPNSAFYGCKSLVSIDIPDAVTSIGSQAFKNCTSLIIAPIGQNVESIGADAFNYCTSLTVLNIPDKVTSIGSSAFSECKNLETVTIGNGLTELPNGILINCAKLKYLSLGNGITKIPSQSLLNCYSLETVVLPENLSTIGAQAFSGCRSLAEINFPASLTTIEKEAFVDCIKLQSITIPDAVSTIGFGVFTNCTALKNATFGSGINSVPRAIFQGCTGLENVTFGPNISSIESGAFNNCKALKQITLPETLTTIGNEAFNQSGLTSIIIPDKVTTIGQGAFYETPLTTVTIPASVKTIGSNAFSRCAGLIDVWCYATTPPLREGSSSIFGVFNYDNCTLHIPYPTKPLYIANEDWKNFLKIREIGKIFITDITLDPTEVTLPIGTELTVKATITPDNAHEKELSWMSTNTDVATVDQTGKVTALAKGTAQIKAMATDDSGVEAVCTVNVISLVKEIQLTAATDTVAEGKTLKINARILPEDADDKTLTWTSSDESIATVNEEGLVTGVSKGKVTITATANDASGVKADITIEVIRLVSAITLDKTEAEIVEGNTLRLTATVEPSDADNNTLSWTSSDEAVATVDQNGLVTAVSKGTAVITASATDGSGVKAECSVRVIRLVSGITLDKTEAEIVEGSTLRLTATVEPSDADNTTLSWTSSDESVATVDQNGLVTAVSKGTAVITALATDGSGVKAECSVRVIRLVSGITLDKTEAEIVEGNTLRLTATVEPSDADNTTLSWTSSDESVATVDQNGLVTAVSKGTAVITASATDGSGVKAECSVRVLRLVSSIVLNPSEKTLAEGETFRIEASVIPEDADNTVLAWSSSNEAVATVDADGLVTTLSLGTATITAATTDGSGVTAQCVITVIEKPLNPAIGFKDGEFMVLVQDMIDLNEYIEITDRPAGSHIVWTSSDNSIAAPGSGDDAGKFTGIAPGTVTVTATLMKDDEVLVSADCILNVASRVTQLVIGSEAVTLTPGDTYLLTAVVYGGSGSEVDDIVWTSANTATVTVDSTGLITAVSVGVANVYATLPGVTPALCTVTVVETGGIAGVETDSDGEVSVDGNNIIVPQGAKVFTISGIAVEPVNLVSGIYIVCLADGRTVKVVL